MGLLRKACMRTAVVPVASVITIVSKSDERVVFWVIIGLKLRMIEKKIDGCEVLYSVVEL